MAAPTEAEQQVALQRARDRELARAAAKGERAAQRQLAERLLDRVRTTVMYLAPHNPDADDLVQRSMLEILRSVGSWRGDSSLETWADRVAGRTAMRLVQQRKRHGEVVTLVADPEPPEWLPTEDAEQRFRIRRRLASLLALLSADRRNAVVLHYVQGCSVAEIAELTETPVNTVRDRLRVGMAALRKSLDESEGDA